MDKNDMVKIGDLEKNSEAIKVVRPNFNKEISRTRPSEKEWANGRCEQEKQERCAPS